MNIRTNMCSFLDSRFIDYARWYFLRGCFFLALFMLWSLIKTVYHVAVCGSFHALTCASVKYQKKTLNVTNNFQNTSKSLSFSEFDVCSPKKHISKYVALSVGERFKNKFVSSTFCGSLSQSHRSCKSGAHNFANILKQEGCNNIHHQSNKKLFT